MAIFDVIGPSPRIEFNLLKKTDSTDDNWKEFRPRPADLSIYEMFKRLIWNAEWNETLFLMSCAEKLAKDPSEDIQQEIFKRIARALKVQAKDKPYLQFRLIFIERNDQKLQKHIVLTSSIKHLVTDIKN